MNCRICGIPVTESYHLVSHENCENIIQQYFCSRCNCFLSDGGVVNYNDADLREYYSFHRETIKKRIERYFVIVEKYVSIRSFLDIGSGMGYSLEVGIKRGWDTKGIEPNSVLVSDALKRGLNVQQGYFDFERGGEYDFILVDNVLEHISDPVSFVQAIAQCLNPDGMLIIAVPPMDWLRKLLARFSWIRRRIKNPHVNLFLDPDQHVNNYSRKAMKKLLGLAKLKITKKRFHHNPLFNNFLFRLCNLDDGYYFVKTDQVNDRF